MERERWEKGAGEGGVSVREHAQAQPGHPRDGFTTCMLGSIADAAAAGKRREKRREKRGEVGGSVTHLSHCSKVHASS